MTSDRPGCLKNREPHTPLECSDWQVLWRHRFLGCDHDRDTIEGSEGKRQKNKIGFGSGQGKPVPSQGLYF